MELKGKRFLVIGGAGFIGSHLVDQLLKEEVAEVLIYDNFCRGHRENLGGALTDPRCKIFLNGSDILHPDLLNAAMANIDGVFHLAALWILHCHDYPRSAHDVNVTGTFNVIEAAIKNKVEKIVYSSSASVYGDALQIPMTEDHPYNNTTFYGASKIAGEHYLKSLSHRYDFDWVGLRYMNVYGPRQDYKGVYTAVIHKILDKIEAGLPPQIFGDGQQQYDFISVSDVARCNILAMKSNASREFFNVGRGIGTSIGDLTSLLLKITESQLQPQYFPEKLSFVKNRIGCIKKAEQFLNFKWQIDLEAGLKELVAWRHHEKLTHPSSP